MAHTNEELVRKGFEAFAKGDMATLDGLFADDATWHSAGDYAIAGDFTGKQEIFANFGRVREMTDTFSQDLHDVLANDDHAVALASVKATRVGRELDSNQVFVFHFDGEQVSSVWVHNYDGDATAAFWS